MKSSRHSKRREVNNMTWWKMAYDNDWVTKEELRYAVKTPENPFGDITKEEYKEITGADFDKEV